MEQAGYVARIDRLVALRRARAAVEAEQARLLHELAADPVPVGCVPDPERDRQWVREEIACALQIAPLSAAALITDATELVTRLPDTLALLAAGDITMRHVLKLLDATRTLPDETVAQLEARVLPRASDQAPGQFAASVRRAVLRLDPRTEEAKREFGLAQRRVCFRPGQDGTTELWALLPAETAAALQTAIDTRADQLAAVGDERTADQRRADALIDLALGNQQVAASVNVTVALSTLLELDQQTAQLDRSGPIPAALARALAYDPSSTWRRLLTDDRTGEVVDAGRATYRPPTPLARLVMTRQTSCVFPGCRRSATRCELDHITAWVDGGETTADNLQPLCPRHHHLKHEAGWDVRRLPDGTTRWRSPAGKIYDRPPDEIPRDTTSDPPDEHAA